MVKIQQQTELFIIENENNNTGNNCGQAAQAMAANMISVVVIGIIINSEAQTKNRPTPSEQMSGHSATSLPNQLNFKNIMKRIPNDVNK